MGLTGGEINAEASAEIGRQRLGAERDKAGRRHTIKRSRGGEGCWSASMGAEVARFQICVPSDGGGGVQISPFPSLSLSFIVY